MRQLLSILCNAASRRSKIVLDHLRLASAIPGKRTAQADVEAFKLQSIVCSFIRVVMLVHMPATIFSVVSRIFRTFGWLSGTRPWLTR